MKIAILGGVHGNEFTGIEVIKRLQSLKERPFKNDFETFLANPMAYEQKKTFY